MQLKELLAIIGYYDNLKIYRGRKQYFFTSKAEVPTYFQEDIVEICGAVAEDVLSIYLQEN
jgi:hypothetical protein